MNFVKPPPRVTIELVGGIVCLLVGVVLALADCKRAIPDEPPITIVDASDADVPHDAGPDASPCLRACVNLVRLGCREGNSKCVETCELSVRARLIHDETIGCIIAAGDRDAATACGVCP